MGKSSTLLAKRTISWLFHIFNIVTAQRKKFNPISVKISDFPDFSYFFLEIAGVLCYNGNR